MTSEQARGTALAMAGAALFGASVPLCKLLAPGVAPLALAGLLYLGAGGSLLMLQQALRLFARRDGAPGDGNITSTGGGHAAEAPIVAHAAEAQLRKQDALPFAGVVIFGAVLGPLCMLSGLSRASGVAASLLLNLEAPFTALLAVLLFREHLGRRGFLAAALLVSGGGVLALGPGRAEATLAGALLLAAACAAWALDNNLTTRLSLRDPVALVRWKGLCGGACTLLLALALGQPLPPLRTALFALLLGAACYGISLAWSVRAMRLLGAARQSALFATAPFAGSLLSVPLLGERLGLPELAAAALMALGLWLLLREQHSHRHTHKPQEHEHAHVHDEHHRHAHQGTEGPEPHSHPHRHELLEHEHAHLPDAHHRHGH
jgi:drug/metabolite transporter (DMT)-like permease